MYFLLFRLYSKILPRKFFALAFILGNLNITHSKYRRWRNVTVCLKQTIFGFLLCVMKLSLHRTLFWHSPNSQHFWGRWCSILCSLQLHTVSAHLSSTIFIGVIPLYIQWQKDNAHPSWINGNLYFQKYRFRKLTLYYSLMYIFCRIHLINHYIETVRLPLLLWS